MRESFVFDNDIDDKDVDISAINSQHESLKRGISEFEKEMEKDEQTMQRNLSAIEEGIIESRNSLSQLAAFAEKLQNFC